MTIYKKNQSSININPDANGKPVYTSEDPLMPKPPKNTLTLNKQNRERIILTKQKQ